MSATDWWFLGGFAAGILFVVMTYCFWLGWRQPKIGRTYATRGGGTRRRLS